MLEHESPTEPTSPGGLDTDESDFADNSLADDFGALIEDGKVYAEAEIAFQKARLSYVADRGKSGAIFGVLALLVLHLALVALALGAILALTPELSAWGATALVVGLLIIIGVLAGLVAKDRFTKLSEAFAQGAPKRKSAP